MCPFLRTKTWAWAHHLPDHHETARDLADGWGSEEVQDRVGGADTCKLTLDVGVNHLGKESLIRGREGSGTLFPCWVSLHPWRGGPRSRSLARWLALISCPSWDWWPSTGYFQGREMKQRLQHESQGSWASSWWGWNNYLWFQWDPHTLFLVETLRQSWPKVTSRGSATSPCVFLGKLPDPSKLKFPHQQK